MRFYRSGKGKSGRIAAIDAMRGLAIILMAFSHGLTWFHTGESRHVIAIFGSLSFGDLATAIFFLVAGISLSLSIRARRRRETPAHHIWNGHSRRFRQLFLLGMPLTAGWGVLQAQAAGLMFITFWALRRKRPAAGEALFITAALAAIHMALKPAAARVPVVSAFFTSDFPVFATTALIAAGFAWGIGMTRENVIRGGVGVGMAAMAGFAAVYFLGGEVARSGMSLGYLLAGGAAAAFGLAAMHGASRHGGPVFRLLALLGRRALFLFLAHYGIIAVLAFGFGWWNKFDAPTAAAAASVLVALTVMAGQRYAVTGPQIYAFLDEAAERVQQWGREFHRRRAQFRLEAAAAAASAGAHAGGSRSPADARMPAPGQAPAPGGRALPVNIRVLRPVFHRVTSL